MNQEDIFAEEAQEEIATSQSQREQNPPKAKFQIRTSEGYSSDDDFNNEHSPLISSPSSPSDRRRPSHQRGVSYQRALDEPWTGAHRASPLPWYKQPSVYWLLPAWFPLCVAFGGIIVPKTYLIQDLICRDLLSDRSMRDPSFIFSPVKFGGENRQCDDDNEVQSKTAIFSLWTSLISGVFSAIVAPSLGALSDRTGRKIVIIFTTFGSLVSEGITIAVGTNPDKLSVNWLLVGYLADGLSGSFTTALALCFAYASDCTAPEKRNVVFGRFHACLFLGIALGPIFSGFLIKATSNIMVPFYFALGCHVFFMLFTSICVPESLSKERRLVACEKRLAETVVRSYYGRLKEFNIFAPLWILWPTGPGSSPKLRRNLLILAAIDTMMFGVAMGTMQIVLIYARKRFHWDAVESAGYLSATNITRVSGLVLILPLLTRWVRGPSGRSTAGRHGSDGLDIGVIRFSVVLDFIGYLGYALTPSGGLMIVSGMIAALGGIGPPTLQSSMTKHIPPDRTGQVLGASGLLHALARVVAPVVFSLIYSETVATYAGFVFLCLASIFVIVFIMSLFLKAGLYLDEGQRDDVSEETEPLQG